MIIIMVQLTVYCFMFQAEIEKSDHDNTSDMAGKVQNETEAEGQNETQDERQNESAAETGTEAEKSKEVEEETEIEKECELDTEKVDTQPEIEEKEEEANTEDRENEGGDSKDEESEKEKEKSAEEEKERDEAAVETYGVVMTTTIPEEGGRECDSWLQCCASLTLHRHLCLTQITRASVVTLIDVMFINNLRAMLQKHSNTDIWYCLRNKFDLI